MAFEGKVVLITGASSGIGAATSLYFAKEGASLALVGRNVERFAVVIEEIKESGVELEPLMILADISVDAERIVTETIDKYGKLDILINSAGFGIYATLETTRIEDFDAMMATNVRGTLLLTQLCAPHLIETKGNIVNISSMVGLRAFKNMLGYSISKAALDQMTRCIAIELAPKGVRVNAINPAVIKTSFHDCLGLERDGPDYTALMGTLASMHPLECIGETDICVNAIAFLANDTSSFITGVTLPLDGGLNVKSPFD